MAPRHFLEPRSARGFCQPCQPCDGGAMLQQEYMQQQLQRGADDPRHAQLLADRAQWMQRIRGEGQSQEESIGNAHVLRDRGGRIRDIEYKSGEVRFRSFEYDAQNRVSRMIVDSQTKGVQIWNRMPNGQWVDQVSGQLFTGKLEVDQKSGAFSYQNSRDGQTHTFGASGQWDVPADRNIRGDGGQRRPVEDRQPDRPPQVGDRQDRPAYEREVNQAFGPREITDRVSYRDNLFGAGAEGKPVVMTFGRSSDPRSHQMIEDLKQAQAACGGKAVFMFVDVDKFDPNSKEARDPNCPIGKYARDYIGTQYGTPLTMVFTQQQGEGKTPVIPEKPTYYKNGDVDASKLQAAISEAAARQQKLNVPGRDVPPPPVPKPEGDRPSQPQPEADKPPVARDVLNATTKFDVASLEKRMSNMDFKDRLAVYQDAIKQADQTGNAELMSRTRAMLGLAAVGWAKDEAAVNNPDALNTYRMSIAYLLAAGLKQQKLYQYPSFQQALLHSGMREDTAMKILNRGVQKNDWFLPQNPADRQDAAKRRAWFQAAMNDLLAPPPQVQPPIPHPPARR